MHIDTPRPTRSNNKGLAHVALMVILTLLFLSIISIYFYNRAQQNKGTPVENNTSLTTTTKPSSPDSNKDMQKDNPKCEKLDIETGEPQTARIICINGNDGEVAHKLTDIYTSHSHSYELKNGNLYILRRIGFDGYPDETWTDELWKYTNTMTKRRLHSGKGLDFRVSEDEKMIYVGTPDSVSLIDENGKELKIFSLDQVILNKEVSTVFSFHKWGINSIWLVNTTGPNLLALAKIDTQTYEIRNYNLSQLNMGPEFTVNIYNDKLAFSNYPALFDVDGAKLYEESGAEVSLMVYDLNTSTQQVVATSVTKKFLPKWLDATTLEFNDPTSESRVTRQIK